MRIAVTSTLSWPFIRRGNRLAYELAVYMAGRGHEVRFITPTPGTRFRVIERDGLTMEFHPARSSPWLSLRRVHKLATFVPSCLQALRRGEFDLVQATYPVDAYVASLYRAETGTPYAYQIYDCLPFQPDFIPDARMFPRAVAGSTGISVISEFVNRELRRECGLTGAVIPPGVDPGKFPVRQAPPTALRASSVPRRCSTHASESPSSSGPSTGCSIACPGRRSCSAGTRTTPGTGNCWIPSRRGRAP